MLFFMLFIVHFVLKWQGVVGQIVPKNLIIFIEGGIYLRGGGSSSPLSFQEKRRMGEGPPFPFPRAKHFLGG